MARDSWRLVAACTRQLAVAGSPDMASIKLAASLAVGLTSLPWLAVGLTSLPHVGLASRHSGRRLLRPRAGATEHRGRDSERAAGGGGGDDVANGRRSEAAGAWDEAQPHTAPGEVRLDPSPSWQGRRDWLGGTAAAALATASMAPSALAADSGVGLGGASGQQLTWRKPSWAGAEKERVAVDIAISRSPYYSLQVRATDGGLHLATTGEFAPAAVPRLRGPPPTHPAALALAPAYTLTPCAPRTPPDSHLTTRNRAPRFDPPPPQFRTYLTRFLLLHDSTCARWWSELPAGSRRLSAPTWRQFRSSVDSGLVRDWSRNEALSANEGTPLSLCYSLIERFGATGQDPTILVQLAILFSLLGTAGRDRRATSIAGGGGTPLSPTQAQPPPPLHHHTNTHHHPPIATATTTHG